MEQEFGFVAIEAFQACLDCALNGRTEDANPATTCHVANVAPKDSSMFMIRTHAARGERSIEKIELGGDLRCDCGQIAPRIPVAVLPLVGP